MKLGIYGDEPLDVKNYAAMNPEFPYESPANQRFDEAQFERYRRLGLHTSERLFRALAENPSTGDSWSQS